jgi:hypothetical protein
LGERRNGIAEVGGSNPPGSTISSRGSASNGRALRVFAARACGPRVG